MLQADLLSGLRDMNQKVMEPFLEMSRKNYKEQKKAFACMGGTLPSAEWETKENPVDPELEEIYQALAELRVGTVWLQAQTMTKMLESRIAFMAEIHELEGCASSNSDLWEALSELRERVQLVDDSLLNTATKVSDSTLAVQRLRQYAQRNIEKRVACEVWKAEAAPRLEEIEETVARLDEVRNVNVERVALDIERKKERYARLQGTEKAIEESARAIELTQRRKLGKLQSTISKEKRILTFVESKVQLMRSTFEAGEWDNPAQEIEYYKELCNEIAEELGPTLVNTLIPDLHETGPSATRDSFDIPIRPKKPDSAKKHRQGNMTAR